MKKSEVLQAIQDAKDVYVNVVINGDQIVSFKVSKKEARDVLKYQASNENNVRAQVVFGNLYIG